jgi:hypothetical protein
MIQNNPIEVFTQVYLMTVVIFCQPTAPSWVEMAIESWIILGIKNSPSYQESAFIL